jgi:hypothetical protein
LVPSTWIEMRVKLWFLLLECSHLNSVNTICNCYLSLTI